MVKWPVWMWFFMVVHESGFGWWATRHWVDHAVGAQKTWHSACEMPYSRGGVTVCFLAAWLPILRGGSFFRCSPVCSYRS